MPASPVMSNPPAFPAGPAQPVRIRHVDSLRAVAACLVVLLHFAQVLGPVAAPGPACLGFLRRLPIALETGRLGVMIFFVVSGFVICRSFGGPREGGARRFLIKRFCRLYPAFWVSLIVGTLAWWGVGNHLPGRVLAANATMIPAAFGQPYVLGVYWTLETELLFYVLCLGLYLARCLDRPVLLAGAAAGLSGLQRLLKIIGSHAGIPLGLPHTSRILATSLSVMFFGAVFRLVYDATEGFRRGVFTHGGTWLLAGLLCSLLEVPDPNFKWMVLGWRPWTLTAHVTDVAALLIFTVWVALLRVDHRALTFLGVISYSLYLFHVIPLILAEHALAAPEAWGRRVPLWLDYLLCGGLAVVLAAAVYRWVERPAIALGKRWAGTRRPATAADEAAAD